MNAFPHEAPADLYSVGIDELKLAKVVALFKKQHLSGAFPGGQLAIRRAGKLVLSCSLGIGRGGRPEESIRPVSVESNTPFPGLSVGKPLAAICIALLEYRGYLDVKAPIVEIFPEFGRHGKERITTLDILTHRSGLLMPDFVKKPHLWNDRAAIQDALINTIPAYSRGTLAYHPQEYGWMLSEIVLRVDGRSLPDFFAEELALPLQLPALRFGLAERNIDSLAFNYWLGKEKVMLAGTNVAENFEWQNSIEFFEANNPATSLVSDASSLAAFYDFLLNGGTTRLGKHLISESIIKKYTTRQVFAWDRTLRAPLSVGRGFVVGTLFPSNFGWWNTGQCFGHAGGFSCIAFGDHRTQLAVAIVTNGNRSMNDFLRRFVALAHGVRSACRT